MVTIVRAGPGDVALVIAAADLFDAPPTPAHTAEFLAAGGHHLLLAVDGDEPVGFVSGIETLHPDKGVEMLVYELGTREDRRREGIATKLLAALAELATERGCYGMWVGTEPDNAAAHAAYRRAGFDGPHPVVHFDVALAPPPSPVP